MASEMRGVVSGQDLESASVDPSARSDEAITLQTQNGRATETHLPTPDLQSASEDEGATGIDLPKLNVPIVNPLLEEVDMTDDVKNWLEEHNYVSVVVTGKSGVGKSTFINIFLGNQEAPVAGGLKPQTADVRGYKCERTINGVTLELFDTPGFETRKHWDNSLKKIRDHFIEKRNPDLVFFCVRMNEIPQSDDYNAMTSLSNAFGPAIWNNTVIVLTRGNQVPPTKFQKYVDDVSEYLKQHLTKGATFFRNGPGVKEEEAKNVPLVPVGDESTVTLSNSDQPWMKNVLLEALTRCSAEGAPALLRANYYVYKLHLKKSFIGQWLTRRKIKPYD